jgi:hypothetical protein
MSTLPDVQPIPSDLSDRTITLTLTLRPSDAISVRSCEVVGRWFRNRVSFQEHHCIDDVLVGRLANAIRSCLRNLPDGTHVLALPEFLVELPGLALSGVHVMVMEMKEGSRNAILRFKEFMGAINNAFRIDIGLQETAPSHGEKLAMNVLEEICLPILNLCRSFEADRDNAMQSLPLHLEDRAREFEFQTELLKRYIYNASMPSAYASDPYLGHSQPPETRFIVD